MNVTLWPDFIEKAKNSAAEVLQKQMKGYLVHKRYWHEIKVNRMKMHFEHFKEMQENLQLNAWAVIMPHWKALVVR